MLEPKAQGLVNNPVPGLLEMLKLNSCSQPSPRSSYEVGPTRILRVESEIQFSLQLSQQQNFSTLNFELSLHRLHKLPDLLAVPLPKVLKTRMPAMVKTRKMKNMTVTAMTVTGRKR